MPEPFDRIAPLEAKRRMDDGWKPYVLDVRQPRESAICTLGFTDRLHPHDTITVIVDELPVDADILIYCRSGARSAHACQILAMRGFTRCLNLEGGILRWGREIDPALQAY